MPTTPTKVKGIKHGTYQQYMSLVSQNQIDPDCLYFITDKGLLYRGSTLVVPRNYTTYELIDDASSLDPNHSTADDQVTFSVETYGAGGQQGQTLQFTVCTKAAVQAIVSTLTTAISNHEALVASDTVQGHTYLSDATNDTQSTAAAGGTAATPAAVAAALAAANQYTNTQIGNLAGAMVFKGTIGAAEAYSASATYAVGDFCEHDGNLYRCTTAIAEAEAWTAAHWTQVDRTVSALPGAAHVGDTYRAAAPGTYTGAGSTPCEVGDLIICTAAASGNEPPQWTVAQNNLDNPVTADDELDSGFVMVGDGQRKARVLTGTEGKFLKAGPNGGATWESHLISDHGTAYGTCNTAADTTAKTVNTSESAFTLTKGGIVTVKFVNAVPAGATLNVKSTGAKAIWYNSAAITDGVILAADTAQFVYDGSHYVLIAVSRPAAVPSALSGFTNDIILYGSCRTAAVTLVKMADLTGYTALAGMIVAIRFDYDVPAGAMLALDPTSPLANHPIYQSDIAITSSVIRGGDTATLMFNGRAWNLLAVDRPIVNSVQQNSHNPVDSDAVYQALQNAALWWEEM